MKRDVVYIMSNKHRTVLYIGVTSNLTQRRLQHRAEAADEGFCGKYRIVDVIYVERYHDIVEAIAREKQLKRLKRAAKERLIRQRNPSILSLAPPFFLMPDER